MRICNSLMQGFEEKHPRAVYHQLLKFGMYKPNRSNWEVYKKLKENNIWQTVDKLFKKYQAQWKGPDIPVYIFPLDTSNKQLVKAGNSKSGVSFKDKLFLFLTPLEDEKELEALFVHEYHHVCRMNKQKREISDYTLLDSMVMEGLAEHAVGKNCGKQYQAKWCDSIPVEEIARYWRKDLAPNLSVKKDTRLHDELLFGLATYPKLLGYAAGFEIVKQYKRRENISDKASFLVPATEFIKSLNL
ncbi:hypothetical protein CVD19_09080 [Bacillus sp. T33-2]|nr:hypothetical protein CVD19_09080 [Bacillus sp. T33-2]